MKEYESEKSFRRIDKFGLQLLVGFVFTVSLLVGLNVAFADTVLRAKPIQCGPKASLLEMIKGAEEEALVGGVGEVLFEDGETRDLAITFFANPIKGTWTIVEFHNPQEACVVAYGGSLTFDVQKYFKKKEEL